MRELRAGIVPAAHPMSRELLEWLEKWHFPATIVFFDAALDHEEAITHHGKSYACYPLDHEQSAACDILFDCGEPSLSLPTAHPYRIHLGKAVPNTKLIIPSLNLDQLHEEHHDIQIPFAAFALYMAVYTVAKRHQHIKQVTLTSLHSVADMGDAGINDLKQQLHAYVQGTTMESQCFPLRHVHPHLPLLFQALPQTSPFTPSKDSQEEWLFHHYLAAFDDEVVLSSTCVRIAALRGLSMSMTFRCADEVNEEHLIDAFNSDPSLICFDDAAHNMYPICADVIHDHRIYIGRMRTSDPHTFSAWAVCDDLALPCTYAVKVAFYLAHNFL